MIPETFQFTRVGDLQMRVAASGPLDGPLVLLVHGWPESWYSWRHQIRALADAGYRVLAPDMRGYGRSDAPLEVAAYRIDQLVADLVGLVEAAGVEQAHLVGHDWGAVVVWHAALLRPDRFCTVSAMSVPHFPPSSRPPSEIWNERYGERFYYILYHQAEGVAEAEYENDPEGLLRMLLASPDCARAAATITDPAAAAGGFIGRWGRPLDLPPWLGQDDLDYYLDEFRHSGFRGGLNYYRNIDANWQFMQDRDHRIQQPAQFIVGDGDLVIAGMDQKKLAQRMQTVVPRLEKIHWLEGAGHWIQQERPEACNSALLTFIGSHG